MWRFDQLFYSGYVYVFNIHTRMTEITYTYTKDRKVALKAVVCSPLCFSIITYIKETTTWLDVNTLVYLCARQNDRHVACVWVMCASVEKDKARPLYMNDNVCFSLLLRILNMRIVFSVFWLAHLLSYFSIHFKCHFDRINSGRVYICYNKFLS